jgi:hypothetical protein
VRGGAAAVSSAVGAWSGAGGGPELSTTLGSDEAKPGLDGRNSVILAPHGFAPAGGALAVTVTSYEDASGAIVDSDIVINGLHAFAVLDPAMRPPSGAAPVSTEGGSGDDDGPGPTPFDLVHVVSHEVGHSLGLADERADRSSLMYALTVPGDPSSRVPTNDDVDGIDAIYGTASATAPGSSGSSGCGQSSVAGSRTHPADAWGALALIVGSGVRLASRRRARAAARVVLLTVAWMITMVACPHAARSAAPAPTLLADAVARVASVSTSNVGGLFETTFDLVPTACWHDPCPTMARAHAWGGTVGGITQRVGGADGLPSVGDVVEIAFVGHTPARTQAAAAVVAVHH